MTVRPATRSGAVRSSLLPLLIALCATCGIAVEANAAAMAYDDDIAVSASSPDELPMVQVPGTDLSVAAPPDADLMTGAANAAAAMNAEALLMSGVARARAGGEDLFALLRQDFAVDEEGFEAISAEVSGRFLDATSSAGPSYASFDEGGVTAPRSRTRAGVVQDGPGFDSNIPSLTATGRAAALKELSVIAFLKALIAEPATWCMLVLCVIGLGWVQSRSAT